MLLTSQALVGLALLVPPPPATGDWNERGLTDYQRSHRGLATKTLRAGDPVSKLLVLCGPTWRRKLGRFTEYVFEQLPGYRGLTILARDGRLRQATQYDCTHGGTFFDDLTPAEASQYQALYQQNKHVPPDLFIGRWGWHRPPRRLWDRDPGVPSGGR
jgi:hypothetical protein